MSIPAWSFVPEEGTHCIELAYVSGLDSFVGVLRNYQAGGPKELVCFHGTDQPSIVKTLGKSTVECFCADDSKLLTSEGRLIDIASATERQIDIS
jgi:hypothetical protein